MVRSQEGGSPKHLRRWLINSFALAPCDRPLIRPAVITGVAFDIPRVSGNSEISLADAIMSLTSQLARCTIPTPLTAASRRVSVSSVRSMPRTGSGLSRSTPAYRLHPGGTGADDTVKQLCRSKSFGDVGRPL